MTRKAPAAQPDLFGDAAPAREVYVPKQEHVISGIRRYWDEMRVAEVWPWDWHDVRKLQNRTFDYYYNLIADPAERALWRGRIEAETARLMASTPPEPPPPPPPDYSDIALPEDNYVPPKRF